MERVKIIFEDEYFLAVDKPAGLVVHNDGRIKEETLTDWVENFWEGEYWRGKNNSKNFLKKFFELFFPRFSKNFFLRRFLRNRQNLGRPHTLDSGRYAPRWGIVNRLDRDTSGLVLIAKDEKTFNALNYLFTNRKIEKKYEAVLHGEVSLSQLLLDKKIFSTEDANKFEIHEAFSRHKKDPRIWVLASDEHARKTTREAITIFQTIKTIFHDGQKFTIVNFWPKTGRTHQLRLHAKFIGHPILGDEKYSFGGVDATLKIDEETALKLRATELIFQHPITKKEIVITC